MTANINLNNLAARGAIVLLTLAGVAFLGRVVLAEFLAGTLSDTRLEAMPDVITAAVEYLPNSAKLHARLAELNLRSTNGDLAAADKNARRAVDLAPNNYSYRLLLASILEARGETENAESCLKDALAIAPTYTESRWRLGNLYLRMDRFGEAVDQFHLVAAVDQRLVPAIIEEVWNYSPHDYAALNFIVKGDPQAQISLSRFLAERSAGPEAVAAVADVNKDIFIVSNETSPLIDSLLKNGFPREAFILYRNLFGGTGDGVQIFNGDLELDVPVTAPSQFNWRLKDTDFARVRFDKKEGHSGSRSLNIDFAGKNTTRLTDEVQQQLVLDPATNYRIEFFVKTQQFQSPEGPRVTITDRTGKIIAASEPVSVGDNDWARMVFNFTSPARGNDDGSLVTLSIRREPRFTYDQPTRGQIWFDDFVITLAAGK